MTRLEPQMALRDRVASIVIAKQEGTTLVMPSAGAVLGVQLGGRVRAGDVLLSTAGVTGLQKAARSYDYVGDTRSILVRFTPTGAACLGVPVSELTNRSVDLEDLLTPARVRSWREQVLNAEDDRESVALTEQLLLGLPFEPDRVVARALPLLASTSGDGAAIASVARSLGLSERQLERRFLAVVGITPKRFVVLARFERALEGAGRARSLTQIALDAGYYDQSHFIRDFKRFAGAPPGRFIAPSR